MTPETPQTAPAHPAIAPMTVRVDLEGCAC